MVWRSELLSVMPEEAAPGRDHGWCKGALAVGSAVQVGAWGMRQERRTGMCTTQLDQVPVAR